MRARPARSPRRWDTGTRRAARWTAGATALLAFAAWEGTQSRRATDAHWSVLGTIACALVAAAVAGRHLQRKSSVSWVRDGFGAIGDDLRGRSTGGMPMLAGAGIWAALIVATISWDLYSFSLEVHSLPTLSRLFGDVTAHDWGRALIFAGWLALGACLTFAWRRGRPDEGTP